MEEQLKNRMEEIFLNNFNANRIKSSLEKTDYLFLCYMNNLRENSEDKKRIYLADIASKMEIPMPKVSRVIKKLQEKGYVDWRVNEEKSRTYVEFTSSAEELLSDENMRMKMFYELVRKEISAEELKNMIQTMQKITNIADQSRGTL